MKHMLVNLQAIKIRSISRRKIKVLPPEGITRRKILTGETDPKYIIKQ